MALVVDYAWARPGVAVLRAVGAVAVCRYLSWLPNGKCLSRSEADTLRAGGIDVVSNWEYYGDWANDYSGGRASGRTHAQEAQRQHLACGGPPTRPIYFSTDFDPTAGQLPTVADYYRGVAEVVGLERTGAYGGYRTIKYLFDAGVIRWGWQTYAWSGGQWDSRAQVRQVRNSVKLAGTFDVDLNETQQADYGQWGYAPPQPQPRSDDVLILTHINGAAHVCDGMTARPIDDQNVAHLRTLANEGALQLAYGGKFREGYVPAFGVPAAPASVALTDEQLATFTSRVVDAVDAAIASHPGGLTGDDVRAAVESVLRGTHFVAQATATPTA